MVTQSCDSYFIIVTLYFIIVTQSCDLCQHFILYIFNLAVIHFLLPTYVTHVSAWQRGWPSSSAAFGLNAPSMTHVQVFQSSESWFSLIRGHYRHLFKLKWNYYNSQTSMPVWRGFPQIISWWHRWQQCVTKVATREQQRCHLGISTARTPTHSRATANTTPGNFQIHI